MAHGKRQVQTIVASLPDDLTADQVMEELRFRLLVEETFKEIDDERGAQAERRASRWVQK